MIKMMPLTSFTINTTELLLFVWQKNIIYQDIQKCIVMSLFNVHLFGHNRHHELFLTAKNFKFP